MCCSYIRYLSLISLSSCLRWLFNQTASSHAHQLTSSFKLFFPLLVFFPLSFALPSTFSVCVHIKDDVGSLSSQSWVCIYRRLLGSEQQHHPRRWALKFILAKQEIKGFFFSLLLLRLHFLLLCSHLYFALQLRLSPFTCLEFRVLSNESSRSHGSKLFFPHLLHLFPWEWQWHPVVFLWNRRRG